MAPDCLSAVLPLPAPASLAAGCSACASTGCNCCFLLQGSSLPQQLALAVSGCKQSGRCLPAHFQQPCSYSPSRTGPLTLRMIRRFWSSRNFTRTWVTCSHTKPSLGKSSDKSGYDYITADMRPSSIRPTRPRGTLSPSSVASSQDALQRRLLGQSPSC